LRVEDEVFAGNQHDFSAFKLADADFWPLQIAQNADRPAVFFSGSTNAGGAGNVVFDRAMRKIHPHDVDTRSHQAFKNFRGR
jgi:hypothetical protein